MADRKIKWPAGSGEHPYDRVAGLAFEVAGRNKDFAERLFELVDEEAAKGVSAAAIYTGVWEAMNILANDVLDEAIDVVRDELKAKAARVSRNPKCEEEIARGRQVETKGEAA